MAMDGAFSLMASSCVVDLVASMDAGDLALRGDGLDLGEAAGDGAEASPSRLELPASDFAAALQEVKRVIKFAIIVAYNLRLEQAYFEDRCAVVPRALRETRPRGRPFRAGLRSRGPTCRATWYLSHTRYGPGPD